jgi:uncharacterized protein (AIM24 family)
LSATGTGDLFFAQDARKIMVLDLNNERMTGSTAPISSPSRVAWTGTIAFEGPGWVLIQPSEGPTVPEHTHPEHGGGLGSLFGGD